MSKKFKFNIVDFIIIAVVVCAVALFCVKFIGGKQSEANAAPTQTVRITFYCEETPCYVPANTHLGDSLYDQTDGMELGTVVDITVGDAVTYGLNADGQSVKSAKEGYNSITIVAELTGATMDQYGLAASSSHIAVGHTITVYAGEGKYYGKIAGLEVIG